MIDPEPAVPLPPGDSGEQRLAERLILELVGELVGASVRPHAFALDGGARITVDGFNASPPILVEAWAHIGPPKPAQKNKVLTDTLKLIWLRESLMKDARCILALADPAAAAVFTTGKTWMANCLRDLRIEVVTVALPPDVREGLLLAQKRQYR